MRKKTYLKLVQYQTEQAKQHLNEVRSIHSVHIPQELRIRSRGTERHSASN